MKQAVSSKGRIRRFSSRAVALGAVMAAQAFLCIAPAQAGGVALPGGPAGATVAVGGVPAVVSADGDDEILPDVDLFSLLGLFAAQDDDPQGGQGADDSLGIGDLSALLSLMGGGAGDALGSGGGSGGDLSGLLGLLGGGGVPGAGGRPGAGGTDGTPLGGGDLSGLLSLMGGGNGGSRAGAGADGLDVNALLGLLRGGGNSPGAGGGSGDLSGLLGLLGATGSAPGADGGTGGAAPDGAALLELLQGGLGNR